MFEQAFKNIDDVLWKDAGCTSELDYTEQSSWLLFLKYLDALERDKATEAALEGRQYTHILDQPFRWESWAAPKGKDGKLDHNSALTGDDLIQFVNGKLFPYLQGFKAKATGPNTIEYKIGEIFGEIKNRIQSGYNLREIIDHIDELRFASQTEKHELSHLYEAKIKNMGNAGRNGGEYYTPRPLIRAIVAVTAPKLGETICDPAVGSAGFLCESFDYLKAQNPKRTTAQDRALQERTFYGKEKKSLAYVIAIMNMILHGIEAPNIIHTNTLAESERAELFKSLASTLYLVTGKSDNNSKCQFPLFLRDVARWDTLPSVSRRSGRAVVEQKSLPRTIKSDDFMDLVAAIENSADEMRLLEQFVSFLLMGEDAVRQFWSLGFSYYALKQLGRGYEQNLLSPIVIFKVCGSVSASGGHKPEAFLRRNLENWGLIPGEDFNLADVIADGEEQGRAVDTLVLCILWG